MTRTPIRCGACGLFRDGHDPDLLWMPSLASLTRVHIDQVLRLEAERDYVRVVVADRTFLIRATLTALVACLGSHRVVRTHRSMAIARKQIVALRHVGAGSWVTIDGDGMAYPIGRRYLATLRIVLLGDLAAEREASDLRCSQP